MKRRRPSRVAANRTTGARLAEYAANAAAEGNVAVLALIADGLDSRRRLRDNHPLALSRDACSAIAGFLDAAELPEFTEVEQAFQTVEQAMRELAIAQGKVGVDRIRAALPRSGLMYAGPGTGPIRGDTGAGAGGGK